MSEIPNPLGPPPWTQQDNVRPRTDKDPRLFLVIWANGNGEIVEAHSMTIPTDGCPYWTFWWKVAQYENRTVLAAAANRIDMVRDITDGETFGGVL